jgi:hypothetical protein
MKEKLFIITDEEAFGIMPADIGTRTWIDTFFNSFGDLETETSAYHVVRLCQELGGWQPFTKKQMDDSYHKRGGSRFDFHELIQPGHRIQDIPRFSAPGIPSRKLVGGGWIAVDADGKHYVTDDFIVRCFNSSPSPRCKDLKRFRKIPGVISRQN